MISQTAPRIPAVAPFTPSRMARVKPYHLAYGVTGGAIDCAPRGGGATAVCVEPLGVSGPESDTAWLCGTASRNSSASSFFCKAQPERSWIANVQPPNQNQVFAYIVCGAPRDRFTRSGREPAITNLAPTQKD